MKRTCEVADLASRSVTKRSKQLPTTSEILESLDTLPLEELIRIADKTTNRIDVLVGKVLSTVVDDIWGLLLGYCNRRTLLSFGSTSKRFYNLANEICLNKFSYMCTHSEEFLKKFTSLKKLKVSRKLPISNETLSHLTSLEELMFDFDNQPPVHCPDYQTISCLTNLKKLDVAELPDWDYEPLKVLTQLVRLEAIGAPDPDMYPLPNLQSLVVYDDIPDFERWTHLTKLIVMAASQMSPDDIKKFSHLRTLSVDSINDIEAPAVSHLTNLTSLGYHAGFTADEELHQIFPKLRKLTTFDVPQHLHCLTNLDHLELQSCIVTENFDNMPNLTRLEELEAEYLETHQLPLSLKQLSISDAGSAFNPCHVSYLTNLTFLEVEYIRLEDTGLTNFTNLVSLRVTCENQNFAGSQLTRLKQLTELIHLFVEIPDEVVAQLPNLQHLVRVFGPRTTPHKFDLEETIIYR